MCSIILLMSLCFDVGHKLTEGTNELKLTCKSEDYSFSVSSPGYNQQFTIPFISAFFRTSGGLLDLKIDKEKNILEFKPNINSENFDFSIFPFDNGTVKGKYMNTFFSQKEKVPFTTKLALAIDTSKRTVSPSLTFAKKKIENYSLTADFSALLKVDAVTPDLSKLTFGANLKKNFFSFGAKIVSTIKAKSVKNQYLLTATIKDPSFSFNLSTEPLEKVFAAAADLKLSDNVSSHLGIDNVKSRFYSVAKFDYKKEGSIYALSLAADTMKTAKVGIKYFYNPQATIELTASKDFTNAWAPKIGLFCTFNE